MYFFIYIVVVVACMYFLESYKDNSTQTENKINIESATQMDYEATPVFRQDCWPNISD